MHWFRSFVLVAAMVTLLAACSSSETPTPEPDQPPEQGQQEAAQQEAPQQEQPEKSQPEMARMQPCKIVNVDDKACTSELATALTEILLESGESDTAAKQAGQAIANAIQTAPLDKRNGFTMSGPDTGKRYSFLFQNEGADAFIVLFQKKPGGDENAYEMITARPLPSCECSK